MRDQYIFDGWLLLLWKVAGGVISVYIFTYRNHEVLYDDILSYH